MLMSFQYIYSHFLALKRCQGQSQVSGTTFRRQLPHCLYYPYVTRLEAISFSLIPVMNMYTSLVLLTEGEMTSKNELSNSGPSLWTLQFQVL